MKTIFVLDLDTQRDFMLPTGALYVPGAERLSPKLRRLFEFVRKSGLTVISPVHAHAPDDWELKLFRRHCMSGTEGQRKLEETLLPRALVLENKSFETDLADSLRRHQQIIVERPEWDIFSSSNMERLLPLLPSRAIVFGVPTEHSVKPAALILKQRRVKVAVLSDLIMPLEPKSGEAALQDMRSAGVDFINLEMLLGIP